MNNCNYIYLDLFTINFSRKNSILHKISENEFKNQL